MVADGETIYSRSRNRLVKDLIYALPIPLPNEQDASVAGKQHVIDFSPGAKGWNSSDGFVPNGTSEVVALTGCSVR